MQVTKPGLLELAERLTPEPGPGLRGPSLTAAEGVLSRRDGRDGVAS